MLKASAAPLVLDSDSDSNSAENMGCTSVRPLLTLDWSCISQPSLERSHRGSVIDFPVFLVDDLDSLGCPLSCICSAPLASVPAVVESVAVAVAVTVLAAVVVDAPDAFVVAVAVAVVGAEVS